MNTKRIGLLVFFAGMIGLLIGLNLDTTVATYGPGTGRVHNIGLLNEKQNFLLVSALLSLVGIILFAIGKTRGFSFSPADKEDLKPTQSAERDCPFCAETIKAKAVLCRYCGNNIDPAPTSIDPFADGHTNNPPPHNQHANVKPQKRDSDGASNGSEKGTDLDEAWLKFKTFLSGK